MCLPGQAPAAPAAPGSAADAVAMVHAGLAWLAAADAGSLTAAEQAECLRGLERAESVHTAARSRVLAAFCAQGGYEDDGHGSARTWLTWQCQLTGAAAAGAIGWMRRLATHPAVAGALARGRISPSWARQICDWTDTLPAGCAADADQILLSAAASGAALADLAHLASEIARQTARPDTDHGDGGFAGRGLRLATTFGGAGKLTADLTGGCAAALAAVLAALGKRAGPEDLRSKWQRDHDALEEACRRLIASGNLPQRAAQPTQIVLHMDLDRLRGLPGAAAAEAAWAGQPTAAPGDDCDATIIPVVTGRPDPAILDRLATTLLHPPAAPGRPGTAAQPGDTARQARAERAARQLILAAATDLLSGPGGLAAHLRTQLAPATAATVSLPLDIGAATDTIPAHLRRAVTVRDTHCRFPGCDQPPAACQPHHIIPRADGGPTSLANLLLLCTFHHLIAIHRWGWHITLHPDATVTATSPHRDKTLHSHSPPPAAAA